MYTFRGTSSKKTKKIFLCDVSGFGSSPKIENFYPGGSILFEFTVKVQDSRFNVRGSRFKVQGVSLGISHVRMYVCTTYKRDNRPSSSLPSPCSKPSSLSRQLLSADAMEVNSKQH